jgi:hypothetical protein
VAIAVLPASDAREKEVLADLTGQRCREQKIFVCRLT